MKEFPYQFTVAWSEADQAYEATVPALRFCVAYGDTPEEAIKEVQTAAGAILKSMEKAGKPLPAVDATLERVKDLQPLLNLSAIATRADIKVQTLASKLARGTALTPDESLRIGKVFTAHGIIPIAGSYVVKSVTVRTPKKLEVKDVTHLASSLLRSGKTQVGKTALAAALTVAKKKEKEKEKEKEIPKQ